MRFDGRTFFASVIATGFIVLVGIGIFVGALIGGAFDSGGGDKVSVTSVPPAAIGNAARGKEVWTSKGCTMCHSFGGSGGKDAPALDYMSGDLSVQSIAGMSGSISGFMDSTVAMT